MNTFTKHLRSITTTKLSLTKSGAILCQFSLRIFEGSYLVAGAPGGSDNARGLELLRHLHDVALVRARHHDPEQQHKNLALSVSESQSYKAVNILFAADQKEFIADFSYREKFL